MYPNKHPLNGRVPAHNKIGFIEKIKVKKNDFLLKCLVKKNIYLEKMYIVHWNTLVIFSDVLYDTCYFNLGKTQISGRSVCLHTHS